MKLKYAQNKIPASKAFLKTFFATFVSNLMLQIIHKILILFYFFKISHDKCTFSKPMPDGNYILHSNLEP